jgi:exodeoxyribonuclease-3
MKIATWNVNSLTVRLPQVIDWLKAQEALGADQAIDVLALQELKMTDDKFPHQAFTDAGIAGTFGDVRVIGGYFPNGQAPDSDKFVYKMRWLEALKTWVQQEMARHPKLALMGDYNITFDDLDVWDPVALAGTIHCTPEERAHLNGLIGLGLHDSFRLFAQPEKSYSWWDYRDFGFRRNRGLRIDHILVTDALKAQATACVIDKVPRKNERPSDHTPVVLTI